MDTQRTEEQEAASELGEAKAITDLNLKALADDFARLLSKHVGGSFEVEPISFNQIENKGPGLVGYGGRCHFEFRATDRSLFSRPKWTDVLDGISERKGTAVT
jgi:hypothetical protein